MARPAWPTIIDDSGDGLTGTVLDLALFTAMKTYINKNLQLTNLTELIITAGGVVTITEAFHTIETAGGGGTDNLDTISGGAAGDILVIRPANDAHTVVVKHSTGNIWLKGKADLSLDDIQDCLMLIYDGTKWMDVGAGGAAVIRYKEINLPAGSWNYPTANPAPLDRDTGANGGMFRQRFDDTTEEFILLEPAFELPDNLDAAGTVYFSLYGYAVVADGNEVQFRISHSAKTEGESWDAAYETKDSGDKTTDAQQDEIDQIEWNETVSNLGWAAEDLIRLMVSRIAIDDGTKVDGDYGFLNLKIRIPII